MDEPKDIQTKETSYIARDKNGGYLVDIQWYDKSGPYVLGFSGPIFEDYRVFNAVSPSTLRQAIMKMDKPVPDYDIFRVTKETTWEFQKI